MTSYLSVRAIAMCIRVLVFLPLILFDSSVGSIAMFIVGNLEEYFENTNLSVRGITMFIVVEHYK